MRSRDFRTISAVGITTAAISVLAILAAPAVAEGDDAGQEAKHASPTAEPTGGEPLVDAEKVDLKVVADAMGISVGSLAEQRWLREKLVGIDFAALDPHYVDLVLSWGEAFSVTYRSTGDTLSPRASAALESVGLASRVTVQKVPRSMEELEAAQISVRDTMLDLRADSSLDIDNGALVLAVTDMPASQVTSRAESIAKIPVEWKEVPELAQPGLAGGGLLNSALNCTGGFIVENSGGPVA